MGNVLSPNRQQILAAAAGNPALLELLESVLNTVGVQQQVTNTTGKNVPPQAKADVSFLNSNYVVQITNPGASSPLSQLQAAQQTQQANQASTVQPVTPILHQIRCATSPRFGVNDNVQTFGGDTGSTQTYWTLSGLGTGNFYFQIRSSYNGTDWNQWKNANGGQSVTSSPSEVTVEQQTNSTWAVFTLPGGQLIAIGDGFVADQGTFTLPENLFSSAMLAIAGPNGILGSVGAASDISDSNIKVVVPSDTSGTVGIPNYPTIVNLKYGGRTTGPPQAKWGGLANLFVIAYDPAGKNITRYVGGTGEWIVITMPGGVQLAFGQGYDADGATIYIPTELASWVGGANMRSICSIEGSPSSHGAVGVSQNALAGTTINAKWHDDAGNTWTGNATWMAVAWQSGAETFTDATGEWVIFTLANGKKIAWGAGVVAAGSPFTLPAGFSTGKMMAFPTPASSDDSGASNVMAGVQQCDVIGNIPTLNYVDGQAHTWSGNVNWWAFAWT